MKPQKTYLGKTAGQWLAQSEICESKAGGYEIFVKRGVIARHHPDGLLFEGYEGPLVILQMGPVVNERFCALQYLRNDLLTV